VSTPDLGKTGTQQFGDGRIDGNLKRKLCRPMSPMLASYHTPQLSPHSVVE
jgi:hypothetical protein